ncbi:MAG: D-alanine--D-alanine ligase [Deltaproteobacteria bacterium]|nr:D-alanine--D-alanine ligase [Deltaproteobacteria bacterium]
MISTPGLAVILTGEFPPDAPPDTLDVTQEAGVVEEALTGLGWRVEPLSLGRDVEPARQALARLRPSVVFNLVDAVDGDGRLITLAPELLEGMRLPFTGAPLEAMAQSSDKLAAKRILARGGLPTPPILDPMEPTLPAGGHGQNSFSLKGGDASTGPWIVKSVWEHASIGLDDSSVVNSPAEALARMSKGRAEVGGDWFAERYVAGREFNLAVVETPDGLRVLPPAEIIFQGFPAEKPRIVGYQAKWDADSFEYRHTRRRFPPREDSPELFARMEEVSLGAWGLFGLKGYARVDFRVDESGQPWVLEINANPCLSPDAGFAAALAQGGVAYQTAIGWIVRSALNR